MEIMILSISMFVSSVILGAFLYKGLEKISAKISFLIKISSAEKVEVENADKVYPCGTVIEGSYNSMVSSTFNAPKVDIENLREISASK